ncbi:hypothetical protein BMF94_3229 [Rhodotorula taiwanensis]|uniref:Myb-like domain-containing protein n=1 Tax=Rhodotorula taiwanensis TaxID=741276 RepID=A0A2S5BA89_9BASI|nr:hypothetical protein BMF94_3229 [Rhodotorula taiwanensis]
MESAGSGEPTIPTGDASPPRKRVRLAEPARDDSTPFFAPPPPTDSVDDAATAYQALEASLVGDQQLYSTFLTVEEPQDGDDALAALNALLANYGDDGVPLGDSALSIDPSLSSDPATLSAEDPADLQASLSSFFADLKSSVDLSVTYPSPVSVTSATPAPSEVSSQSRGSSSSVEPEAQTAVAADAQTEASSSSSSSSSSSKKKGSASSKRRYWTAEQDAALVKLREEPDKHDWTWNEIAAKLDCGHRSVQCRARYLLLKDKQKSASRNRSRRISWPRDADLRRLHLAVKAADEDAKAQGRKTQHTRSYFTTADDAVILSYLLDESWVDWSAVGTSLTPPRTGDSCYQRARKLRKKTPLERQTIMQHLLTKAPKGAAPIPSNLLDALAALGNRLPSPPPGAEAVADENAGATRRKLEKKAKAAGETQQVTTAGPPPKAEEIEIHPSLLDIVVSAPEPSD